MAKPDVRDEKREIQVSGSVVRVLPIASSM